MSITLGQKAIINRIVTMADPPNICLPNGEAFGLPRYVIQVAGGAQQRETVGGLTRANPEIVVRVETKTVTDDEGFALTTENDALVEALVARFAVGDRFDGVTILEAPSPRPARVCRRRKSPRAMMPMIPPVDCVNVRPSAAAVLSDQVNSRMPMDDRHRLGRSILPYVVERTSRSRNGARIRKARTTGMLIRNTEPHSNCRSSIPPIRGPMAKPAAKVAAKMPIARARRRGSGNRALTIARPEGNKLAPPSPISARAAIRPSGDCE